jgi:hypothetical protein
VQKTGILLLLITLVACEQVLFREPQPKGVKPLSAIPEKVQGKYLLGVEDGSEETDTVYIYEKEFRIGSEGNDIRRLGDSIRFASYKGWYFVSFREKTMWDVKALKRTPEHDLEYYSIDLTGTDAKRDSLLRVINELVPVQNIPADGDTLHVIDPTPKQLLSMVRKGYFSRVKMKRVASY